jgi:hypothetical protein
LRCSRGARLSARPPRRKRKDEEMSEKFTKEEIKAALDEMVEKGILKVVGTDANGDPIYQETENTKTLRENRKGLAS